MKGSMHFDLELNVIKLLPSVMICLKCHKAIVSKTTLRVRTDLHFRYNVHYDVATWSSETSQSQLCHFAKLYRMHTHVFDIPKLQQSNGLQTTASTYVHDNMKIHLLQVSCIWNDVKLLQNKSMISHCITDHLELRLTARIGAELTEVWNDGKQYELYLPNAAAFSTTYNYHFWSNSWSFIMIKHPNNGQVLESKPRWSYCTTYIFDDANYMH